MSQLMCMCACSCTYIVFQWCNTVWSGSFEVTRSATIAFVGRIGFENACFLVAPRLSEDCLVYQRYWRRVPIVKSTVCGANGLTCRLLTQVCSALRSDIATFFRAGWCEVDWTRREGLGNDWLIDQAGSVMREKCMQQPRVWMQLHQLTEWDQYEKSKENVFEVPSLGWVIAERAQDTGTSHSNE